jgi:hypothetical protein
VAGLLAVVLTMVFRRWRHLLVFLCSLFLLELAITLFTAGTTRPRPYGVLIIGRWTGYSTQALAVTVPAFLLMGIAYCLVVPGRPRTYAKAAAAVIVTVFCLARLYLAVDHVDDLLLGVALAIAIPVSAFRFFTPNEVFPVAYRRGNTAHVDVTGARGEAIRQGVRDQLGLTVTGITPVGPESSAGSTPLRLRVEGAPQEHLFGKLYTKGHVRADHWYKLWRTILYGSLEDENSFGTVRRLAEYEDYALRLLEDVGIAVARPYGIVEITPEREYLLVTEFFDGAVEIGGADIDDQVIDQGLRLIRTLWDAGVAHRDIKPGNLMVRAGQLRPQRGRRPDTAEQRAHRTMPQQVHVIDRIRPGGHPGHQAPDLQVRVNAALAARPDVLRDQIRQPGTLRERHHRHQPGVRHQIRVIEGCLRPG